MTRKEFLQFSAGAVAVSAVANTASAAAAAEKPGPKRGVSIYSYSDDIFKTVTFEDCLAFAGDLASPQQPEIGLEILANPHIEGYPNPTDAWVMKFKDLCKKHHLKPVEYGHWVDSKLWNENEPWLSTKESYDMLVQDIKLANKLGFTCGRSKMGVIDGQLAPVPNWREFIKMALPVAEKYNFRMLPEIHSPTKLKSKMMDDYVDFIQKEKTTPWFGLNIDFGVFQNRPASNSRRQAAPPAGMGGPGGPGGRGGEGRGAAAPRAMEPSKIEEMIPLLPYVHCCHAKFVEMNDDCEDPTTPYAEIIKMLVEHKWNGYMMSEYEGADRSSGGAFAAVRKQHVMLRKLLGEV